MNNVDMVKIKLLDRQLPNCPFTWWSLRPLWLNDDFGPSSEDCGPHPVIEGMCCQAEEFIAAVSAQAMD